MIEVHTAIGDELEPALKLLEHSLRDGKPLPNEFDGELRGAVERGELEVLIARSNGELVGVAVLAFRLSVSAGGRFASIEELYVRTEARRQGVGRTLLEAAAERCSRQSVSYVEVQVVDSGAETFYKSIGFECEVGVRVMSLSHPLRR